MLLIIQLEQLICGMITKASNDIIIFQSRINS